MTVSLKGSGELSWPSALDPKAHDKANKKKEIDAVVEMLTIAQKQYHAISDFPFPPAKATIAAAQRWGEQALAFLKSGNFPKLIGSLKVIGKRCETLLKTKISKEALAALKSIKSAADGFVAEADDGKILPVVNARVRELVEKDKEATLKSLKTVFKNFKSAAGKGHPGLKAGISKLKDWSADPEAQKLVRQAVHNGVYDDCRDMTQNLQNITKALSYDRAATGISDRAADTIPKLAKTLIPFANAKGSITAEMELPQLKSLLTMIAAQAQLYDRIAEELPS